MSKTLTIGITNLSFHHVTGSLIANILQEMGFEVERVYSSHEENFNKLKAGDVDLLCSAWLPSSHGIYKLKVEEATNLIELGLHYEPYALWGVPDYIPESDISQISDLLKPEVIKKMKSSIQGINIGAGISRFSIKMISEYGLEHAGYEFLTGTEEDCFGTFERAVEKKEWVIVPLWKPQFLHYKHQIRELDDPKGILGIIDRAVMLLREDKKYLFTTEQLEKLDALHFSNDIIAELDYQVCRENKQLDEVTSQWLAANGI